MAFWPFGLLALASSVAIAVYCYGSIEGALAKLRGESLTAPGFVDYGKAKVGEIRSETVTIKNWTANPVRLIGGTSDCTCVTTTDMPVVISPFGSKEISINWGMKAETSGNITRMVELWTDCDNRRKIYLTLGCRIENEP